MSNIAFSKKQSDFIFAPYNHCLDVAEGSPRSGKTFAATARFACNLLRSRDHTHLVAAYSQEQAYRLIIDGDGFGLMHIFANESEIRHNDNGDYLFVHLKNGDKKVYFKGGGKADSRKSITGMSLGSVYFCEIDLLHPDMVQECFRRTFAAHDRWHIADLNPPAPMHPVISDVFEVQDSRWTHWTLDDNPIITPVRKEEIRLTCLRNPYLYRRDYLGERAIPAGVIYGMFDDKRHILHKLPDDIEKVEMFFAGDGGLTDATSVGCYIIGRKKDKYILFRVANWYYGGGCKAMSVQAREIVTEFLPYCRNKYDMMETDTFIDPACKALRMELELCGHEARKADNNGKDIKGNQKGIRVGIEYLQSAISDESFFVVDDERYDVTPFIREIGMYCVDDNGNPIDKYNHCMDECRYACNYYYKYFVL